MIQINVNIIKHWKSETTQSVLWNGEMRFPSERWIGFREIWGESPARPVVCPSLSIQAFSPGGRHISQVLVQTLAEISALVFLVTWPGQLPVSREESAVRL